jgi:hypothetical protein
MSRTRGRTSGGSRTRTSTRTATSLTSRACTASATRSTRTTVRRPRPGRADHRPAADDQRLLEQDPRDQEPGAAAADGGTARVEHAAPRRHARRDVLLQRGRSAADVGARPGPAVARAAAQIMQDAIDQLRALSRDIDVQPDPRLAQAPRTRRSSNANRWQSFLGDLAEFHSRLMRHCLVLVARYYDAERQIQIRGQYGWQPLQRSPARTSAARSTCASCPAASRHQGPAGRSSRDRFIQANWPGAVSPGGRPGRDSRRQLRRPDPQLREPHREGVADRPPAADRPGRDQQLRQPL